MATQLWGRDTTTNQCGWFNPVQPAPDEFLTSVSTAGDITTYTMSSGATYTTNTPLTPGSIASTIGFIDCAGVPIPAAAQLATCADLSAAIGALPADLHVNGWQSYDAATNILTLTLNDGSTVPIDLTDLVNDAVAEATSYVDCAGNPISGGSSLVVCGSNNFYDAITRTPGDEFRIAPLNNDHVCSGAVITVPAPSAVNVATAFPQPDGSHLVTLLPSACAAGVWSYDYVTTCPDGTVYTSTVSGTVDNSPKALVLHLDTTLVADVQIVTDTGLPYDVDWGDGSPPDVNNASGTAVSHNYLPAYTGDVTITVAACSKITLINSTQGNWNYSLAQLPEGIQYVKNLSTTNTIFGSINDLPSSVILINVRGNNVIEGSLSSFNPGMSFIYVSGNNTIMGDLASSQANPSVFQINGNNTISGNVSSIGTNTSIFNVTGSNTITGLIQNMPTSVTQFVVDGNNTISGDIGVLPGNPQVINVSGNNTISGSINTLPASLNRLILLGNNTVTGSTDNIPNSVVYTELRGNNTVSGLIQNMPINSQVYIVDGNNTVSGDINNIPASVTITVFSGNSNVNGDIANLKVGLTNFFAAGTNTITGDIANLPSTLVNFRVHGQNTITAAGSSWPMQTVGFQEFIVRGTGQPAAVVDNWLAAADNVTFWAGFKTVDVAGSNAAPTAAGLASCANIIASGALICNHN